MDVDIARAEERTPPRAGIERAPTGVAGLDEVLDGGLPRGRPTLVCGAAGSGKTILGMQFLVNGAEHHGEPGVFIAFEERPEDLAANVRSLGFDLRSLEERGLVSIDHVSIDPAAIVENGEYDLEGLFLRLGLAIDSVGAKHIVLDTLETLFGALGNYAIVRSELKRLFDWLKERQMTAVITAERGDGKLTRHGLEEYVSDCVIVLDHRVDAQVSTRRLRVVKYRGSAHGTNEFPFIIDERGFSVLPITSVGLEHHVSNERVSSGIARLDTMLGGEGYYRGSTILISGPAGSGKTSLCAHFAEATCRAGERALFFSFEESPDQIVRNMRSIGIDLSACRAEGLLRFVASRPTAHGIETHLALIHRAVQEFRPSAVVFDPVSNFIDVSDGHAAHQMLMRVVDHLKLAGVTAVFTTLTHGSSALEGTGVSISSIVDTWLLVKNIEVHGERNRGLYVLKSRGMPHSNQIREFVISERGIELVDVYVGGDGVLTGTARQAQESRDREAARASRAELERTRRELERKRALYREQLARLQAEYESDIGELEHRVLESEKRLEREGEDRDAMASTRRADRKRPGAKHGSD
jgi:circadian clock protein KaiC